MNDRRDVIDEAQAFLVQCGSCDFALNMGCVCPDEDYRPVMLRLVEEVERLRSELLTRDHMTAWADGRESHPDEDEDECPDVWHVIEFAATDACPTCGYVVGGLPEGETP